MATERLDIVVTENGSRTVKKNLDDLGGTARGVSDAVGFLKKALVALGIGLTINELRKYSDQYKELRNQIRLVTESQLELNAVTDRIFQLSQNTRTLFSQNAAIFNDLVQATQDLSFTTNELLDAQENLNKVIQVGGGNFEASAQALNSIILKMQDGTVESREFRAVLTQLPDLADVLAKAFNKSIPEIVRDVEDGRITLEEFLGAILRSGEAIDKQFQEVDQTIAGASTRINNAFTKAFGEFDKRTGTSENLIEFLNGVADSMTDLQIAFTVAAEEITRAWTEVLRAFGSDLVGGKSWEAIIKDRIDSAAGFFDTIVAGATAAAAVLNDITNKPLPGQERPRDEDPSDFIARIFNDTMDNGILARIQRERAKLENPHLRNVFFPNGVLNGSSGSGSGGFTSDKELERIAKEQAELDKLTGTIDGVTGAKLQLATAEAILDRAEASGSISTEERNRLLTLYRKQLADTLDPLSAINRELDDQINVTQMSNREQTIQNQLKEIQNQLLAAGVELDDEQTQLLRDKLGMLSDLADQQERYNEALQKEQAILQQINGPAEDYAETVRILNDLLADGRIDAEDHFEAMRDALINYLDTQQEVGAGIARGLLKLQKEYTDFASTAEGAVRDAFQGAEDAIVQFSKTGKANFSEFIDGLIEDLQRLAIRTFFGQLLTSITNSLIGSFGSGGDTPQALGTVGQPGSAPGYGFHTGRAPGEFHQTRLIANMLAGALPRHHNGVGPGEHAAVIRNDEWVLTPQQMAAMKSKDKLTVNIYDNSSNSQVSVEEAEGPFGERELRILVDDANATNMATRGSKTDSILRTRYNARQRLASR